MRGICFRFSRTTPLCLPLIPAAWSSQTLSELQIVNLPVNEYLCVFFKTYKVLFGEQRLFGRWVLLGGGLTDPHRAICVRYLSDSKFVAVLISLMGI